MVGAGEEKQHRFCGIRRGESVDVLDIGGRLEAAGGKK